MQSKSTKQRTKRKIGWALDLFICRSHQPHVQAPFHFCSSLAKPATLSCPFPRLRVEVAASLSLLCDHAWDSLVPPLRDLQLPLRLTSPESPLFCLQSSSLAKGQGSVCGGWERFLCQIWWQISGLTAFIERIACGMTNISSSTPTLFVYQVFS